MLDLHRLRLLRELSYRGTLRAVAASLGYSPSAVSQQLSKLEAEAGVQLLETVGRRVRLTPQAERLVVHADALLERLEQAEAELAASTQQTAGTLRVASFQSAAFAFLPPVLSQLAGRHPALCIEVAVREPEEALPGLLARDFDLVVDESYPGDPPWPTDQLDREELFQEPLLLAVPAAWGRVEDVRELSDRPWTLEPLGTPARSWSTAHCRGLGFEPDVRFSLDDMVMRLRFVATGHAAALLPELSGARHAHGIDVLALPGDPKRRISTVARQGAALHPAVVAFRSALQDVVRSGRATGTELIGATLGSHPGSEPASG